MVAVVAVCRSALVGTGWTNFALVTQMGLENTTVTLHCRGFISGSEGNVGSEQGLLESLLTSVQR